MLNLQLGWIPLFILDFESKYQAAYEAECSLSAFASAMALKKSRWTLESRNTSSCLIFKLPSSSVAVCAVISISRIMSIPTEVFAVAVTYEESATLRTSDVHSSIWDANVSDYDSRDFYDEVKGRLRKGFSKGERESGMYRQPMWLTSPSSVRTPKSSVSF